MTEKARRWVSFDDFENLIEVATDSTASGDTLHHGLSGDEYVIVVNAKPPRKWAGTHRSRAATSVGHLASGMSFIVLSPAATKMDADEAIAAAWSQDKAALGGDFARAIGTAHRGKREKVRL